MPDLRAYRLRLWLIAALLLLAVIPAASAQTNSLYWESWNSTINVSASAQSLEIAESQMIVVDSGSIGFIGRSWADPVEIDTVYINDPDGNLVELRRATSGETPSTYLVTASGDETNLRAYLPERYRAGEAFLFQINYSAPLFTENLVDWYAVPESRGAVVNNALVRVNFIDGEPPAQGLARVASNNATVTVSGSVVSVATNRPLEDGEPLWVQMPFGAGSGAASNEQAAPIATTAPRAATPAPSGSEQLGLSLEGLLPIICVVIVVIIILSRGGGGGLGGIIGLLLNLFLRGGGGGLGGGTGGGGIFGGGSGGSGRSTPPTWGGGGSSGGSSGGGGFRRSSSPPRRTPTVRNRKGGGGASFG